MPTPGPTNSSLGSKPNADAMRSLLGLVLALTTLPAELSPDHYRRLQDEAMEALVVKTDQVDVKTTFGKDGEQFEVHAKATVQSVIRSKAGHKPGDAIQSSYSFSQTTVPMPGPSKPTILEKGATVRAYLNPVGNRDSLGPAAYGHSFQKP